MKHFKKGNFLSTIAGILMVLGLIVGVYGTYKKWWTLGEYGGFLAISLGILIAVGLVQNPDNRALSFVLALLGKQVPQNLQATPEQKTETNLEKPVTPIGTPTDLNKQNPGA